MSATRSARLATSRSCASVLSSCVPKITGSFMVHRLSLKCTVRACVHAPAWTRTGTPKHGVLSPYETNDRPSLPQVRPAGLEPATSSFGGSRSAPAELRALALSLPDSNQRPRVYQTRALPTELRDIDHAPGGSRTPSLRVRSPALCPVELQAQHVWTRSRTWDARLFGPPLYRLSSPDESSRRDSNPRPRGPEPRALPAAPLLGENRSGREPSTSWYGAAEDDRLLYPAPAGTAGLEPAPFRVTGGRAVRLRHAPVNHICSRRRRTRGRPSRHQRESRPRQARRNEHPAAGGTILLLHTHTDGVNERPPPPPVPPPRPPH